MDWEEIVEAAKRHERLIIKAGGVVVARGESYMEGDILCIKCDPKSGGGIKRYKRDDYVDGGLVAVLQRA